MRLIDADALTLCTYDYDCCCGPFKAVPEETLNNAPTLVVGPDGDVVPEIMLAKWYKPEEKLPETSGLYICVIKDDFDTGCRQFYKRGFLFVKDNPEAKDGWYHEFTHKYGYFAVDGKVLYWLQEPQLPEGVVLS